MKKKVLIADFSKAGSYKGKKWVALENKIYKNPKKFSKFKPATNAKGFTEVKRGYLYHEGEPVVRGKIHEYELGKSGKFAMTKTYYLGMKKTLKPFKLRKIA